MGLLVLDGDKVRFSTKVRSIFYSMDFTHGLRRALIMGLALVYFVSLGFNVVWISSLFAIGSIVAMLLEFPTGAVADYDSRKKSLLISYTLFSFAFLGIFFTNTFWLIAFFWILSEVAWTFSTGAGSAMVIDALGIAKKKSKIVKLISRGYIFEKSGRILGGFLGMVIIAINFRLIWLIAGLMYLVLGFIVWKYMEERNFKPDKIKNNYFMKSFLKAKESFDYIIHEKNRNLRVLMLASILSTGVYSIFYFCVPLFFTQTMGMKPEFYSGLLSVLAILCLGGPLVTERIVKKKGYRILLFSISVLGGISIMAMGFSNLLAAAIFFFAVLEVSGVIFDIVSQAASHNEYDSKIRASLGSVSHITWALSNSIGLFLAGVLISLIGVPYTLIVSGGIVFLMAFVYLGMREK